MIKLIASDMDGTLLDSKMQISAENIAAIKYAQDHGVEFMVATGRNRPEALPPLKSAGIDCAMINLNGAEVFDINGQSLFSVPIEKKTVKKIFDLLNQHDIYFEVATNHGLFSESEAQRIEKFAGHIAEMMPHLTYKMAVAMTAAHLEFLPMNYITHLPSLLDDPQIEFLKVIGFGSEDTTSFGTLAKAIDDLGDLAVTSSGSNNIEINHRNAQKGIAVAHVAKERGIELHEVMTIGDNFNDLSMIQLSPVSFAMANGVMELKEAAAYQTVTNIESGVGKAIRRAIDENL
ncbi:MAG: Cof-type HAD-IIB family hydrolase [Enterococcus sp.]